MESVISAVITSVITGCVTLFGVLISNGRKTAVMENKIDVLTEKVNKHNNLIERMYKLEGAVSNLQHDIKRMEDDAK